MAKKIDPWGTHLPVLATVVAQTTGPVLELGAGNYSTPLLHLLCAKMHRPLYTLESDAAWLAEFKDLESWDHSIIHVPDWDAARYIEEGPIEHNGNHSISSNLILPADVRWAVAFVDHEPHKRRGKEILRLMNHALHIVVHDADDGKRHGFEDVLPAFRHRSLYKRYSPNTMVVSQFEQFDVELNKKSSDPVDE